MFNKCPFVAAQILDVIFVGFSRGENGINRKVFVLRKYLIVSQTNIFIKQTANVLIENLVANGSSCFLYKSIITQSDKLVQLFEVLFGHAVV